MTTRLGFMALLVALAGLAYVQLDAGPEASPSSSPHGLRFGLGLDIPDEFPAPGPMQESPEDLERLEAFIEQEIPNMVDSMCGIEDLPIKVNRDEGDHLVTLLNVNSLCSDHQWGLDTMTFDDPQDGLDRWIMGQIQNGTVGDAYAMERERSVRSVERAMAALDNAPTPADPVEAQLLAWLADRTQWDLDLLDSVIDRYETYQGDPPFGAIRSAFLNLGLIKYEGRFTQAILDAYPWRDPACTPSVDPQAVEERVRGKLEAAMAAHPRPDPAAEFNTSRALDRIHSEHKERFDLYAEHDWWPALLWLEQVIDWHVAMAEHPGDVYPSKEEGEYLFAQYRTHTHTLSTEHITGPFHAFRFLAWDDFWGVRVHTFDALQWRFGDVGCAEA